MGSKRTVTDVDADVDVTIASDITRVKVFRGTLMVHDKYERCDWFK